MGPALANRTNAGLWRRVGGTIFGLYVAPVLLLQSGAVPFAWRYGVLFSVAAAAMTLAFFRHSPESLGLKRPRLGALFGWAILPAAGVVGLIAISGLTHRMPAPAHAAFYVFFALLSAPAQEFLYRGFLFAELATVQVSAATKVLLSSFLFGFMHIIYRDALTVILTLLAGLLWAALFQKTRRVTIVAASHAVLGVAAIFAGLI